MHFAVVGAIPAVASTAALYDRRKPFAAASPLAVPLPLLCYWLQRSSSGGGNDDELSIAARPTAPPVGSVIAAIRHRI
jgi:hypothetical protein